MIYFPYTFGVGGICFLANSLSSNDPVFKAWKYGMVLYLIEIPDPKFPFSSTLTNFQQYMFKRIHWIFTSLEGPTKIIFRGCLMLEVYSTLIEYENGKGKPTHHVGQIVDCDDLNNQQ